VEWSIHLRQTEILFLGQTSAFLAAQLVQLLTGQWLQVVA
jgi:hypothetical protein